MRTMWKKTMHGAELRFDIRLFSVLVVASLHPKYPLDTSVYTMLGTTHWQQDFTFFEGLTG